MMYDEEMENRLGRNGYTVHFFCDGDDCDIFFDVLPENETLERAMEKADIAWESLHWRDKRKQRLSLCIVDKDTEEILESLKDYE